MKTKLLALILLCAISTACFAQGGVPICEANPDFYPRCYLRSDNYLIYYIYGQQEGLEADSVWIVNSNDEFVMAIHALSGEMIDVSFLSRGYYGCRVQLGECIGTTLFYKRKSLDGTGLSITIDQSPIQKILRDGVIYILRDGKYYSLLGAVIH